MSEKLMWASLQKAIGIYWDAQRHEDVLAQGLPDVSFGCAGRNGWIELKYIEAWPKKEDTIVRIKHFTPQQKAWLLRRQKMGGCCWLLLRVGATNDWLIFHPLKARFVGDMTEQEMFNAAAFIWSGIPKCSMFLHLITEGAYDAQA